MKTILFIAALFTSVIGMNAQTAPATQAPDQNPNYYKSRDKYMAKSEELLANQGKTIQETYKAIDDMQLKQERKDLARQRRHERRMARIQSRGRYYYGNNYYNSGYYGNGYGYNSNYYNGYANPYGYYHPSYYNNNIYGNVNGILNTALLGVALWSILKH